MAVQHLVTVNNKPIDPSEETFGTDIELKTDLTRDQVITHTACNTIGMIFDIKSSEEWKKKNILPIVVERLERKFLSLDRKSRFEVVEVARPHTANSDDNTQNFLRRLFAPRP